MLPSTTAVPVSMISSASTLAPLRSYSQAMLRSLARSSSSVTPNAREMFLPRMSSTVTNVMIVSLPVPGTGHDTWFRTSTADAIVARPPSKVHDPTSVAPGGAPWSKPSNSTSESPGVVGFGSQRSLMPSPSASAIGSSSGYGGHGSHRSPKASPSSLS